MNKNTLPGYSSLSFAQFEAGSLSPTIQYIDASLAEILYQSGISPKQWQHGVNIMLQKQEGNFQVEKLRGILLYEADFNQNNKQCGRDFMAIVEKHGALAVDQFGNKLCHTAIVDQSHKSGGRQCDSQWAVSE